MSLTVMLLLLSASKIEQKDIPLQEAPQVVCPLSLQEYASTFRWWARREVIERQKTHAEESKASLLRRQI